MSQYSHLQSIRDHISRTTAFWAGTIAIAALCGWIFELPFLRSPFPGLPQLKINTALTLLAAAAALCLKPPQASKGKELVSNVLAAVVVFVGASELFIYTGVLSFAVASEGPGGIFRMSPQSALSFILLGGGLLLLRRGPRAARTSEIFVLVAFAITFAAVLGHLYRANLIYGASEFNRISINGAFGFLLLEIGCLAANRYSRFVQICLSTSVGGVTARRLLPLVIFPPAVIGWLLLQGRELGLYDIGVGVALTVFSLSLLMFWAVFHVVAMIHRSDVRRTAAEGLLAEKELRFRELFEHSQGILSTSDTEGRITSVNPAFAASLGYSADELVGRSFEEFLPDEYRQEFQVYLRKIVNEGEANGLVTKIAQNGRLVVWQYHNILVSEAGKKPYVLGNALDVTHLMHVQRKLRRLSLTDELTGLQNRRGFLAFAERQMLLEKHSGTARGLSLLFADMDGLKYINDNFGHEAGSNAIIALSNTLRSIVRSADLIGRWGGDEFVMLLIGSDDSNIEQTVERIQDRLNEFNKTSGLPYRVACSIGVAPVVLDGTRPIEVVIAEADAAMYANKQLRRAERGRTQSGVENAETPLPFTIDIAEPNRPAI